jgi:hypothetical protein
MRKILLRLFFLIVLGVSVFSVIEKENHVFASTSCEQWMAQQLDNLYLSTSAVINAQPKVFNHEICKVDCKTTQAYQTCKQNCQSNGNPNSVCETQCEPTLQSCVQPCQFEAEATYYGYSNTTFAYPDNCYNFDYCDLARARVQMCWEVYANAGDYMSYYQCYSNSGIEGGGRGSISCQ